MENIKQTSETLKQDDKVYVKGNKESRIGIVKTIEEGYVWVSFPDNKMTYEQYPLGNIIKIEQIEQN